MTEPEGSDPREGPTSSAIAPHASSIALAGPEYRILIPSMPHSEAWAALGGALIDSGDRVVWETIAVGIVIVLAVAWGKAPAFPGLRSWQIGSLRPNRAIFAATALPMLMRLALLPLLPIPQPYQPDEFSHLLLAHTFASGRIANPAHPMWHYFETLYVLHQPVYTSPYPAAQGLVMAVPLALGAHPWFGVCASMGLMCGALAWMLQGWVPPQWALLGALIAGARLSISSYWMNSYWGGALSAFGGALLIGALPRLLRRPRVRHAIIAAAGVAILSQSRPFEGALLSLPIGTILVLQLARKREFRVLAVLACTGVAIGAATLYYNWRVTGNALLWPYQLHQKIYGTPQNLRGSAPVLTAERAAVEPDLLENFHWQLDLFERQSTWKGLASALPEKAGVFWDFYFQPILTLPLLFLPLSLRRPGVRFALLVCTFVLATTFVMYPFFFPHYAAPLYGLLLLLMVEGARRMRTLRWGKRKLGMPLFRWWAAAVAASCLSLAAGAAFAPELVVRLQTPRSRIERKLETLGGKHLVIVRYRKNHNFHHPWIYNAADIDRSRVVWARELDPPKMAPLLDYYKDRTVWLVEAGGDDDTPELLACLHCRDCGPSELYGFPKLHSGSPSTTPCQLSSGIER